VVAGIARGLGCKAGARSPTFTLVNEYHGRLTLAHADLYRVDEREVEALDLEDRGDVLAVEWGEKLPARFRRDALRLEIGIRSESERTFAFRAEGERGRALLAAWQAAVRASSTGVG
jgi:tRNA threonylcarbamoyladenosine biosynthesis protein TsaE